MKILDPQSATITNIEVLAHLTANPPRRSPNPFPNSRTFTPKPDLRDHNTVVKEIHNYVSRLSPHLYNYPKYTHDTTPESEAAAAATQHPSHPHEKSQDDSQIPASKQQEQNEEYHLPQIQPAELTDLEHAIREVITRLKPFGLTKAEVIMIINLGVAIGGTESAAREGEEEGEEAAEEEGTGGEAAEEEGEGGEANADATVNGAPVDGDGDVAMGAENGAEGTGEEAEGEEAGDDDYGAMVLLDTVIEDREERMSNEDIAEILKILKETLGSQRGRGEKEGDGREGG